MIFEQSQFQKVSVALAELYLFELPSFRVIRENYFKAPKLLLDKYIFTIKMVNFANFVQRVDFERFRRVGVAIAEFYLFELPLFRVLRESCLKV